MAEEKVATVAKKYNVKDKLATSLAPFTLISEVFSKDKTICTRVGAMSIAGQGTVMQTTVTAETGITVDTVFLPRTRLLNKTIVSQ